MQRLDARHFRHHRAREVIEEGHAAPLDPFDAIKELLTADAA